MIGCQWVGWIPSWFYRPCSPVRSMRFRWGMALLPPKSLEKIPCRSTVAQPIRDNCKAWCPCPRHVVCCGAIGIPPRFLLVNNLQIKFFQQTAAFYSIWITQSNMRMEIKIHANKRKSCLRNRTDHWCQNLLTANVQIGAIVVSFIGWAIINSWVQSVDHGTATRFSAGEHWIPEGM